MAPRQGGKTPAAAAMPRIRIRGVESARAKHGGPAARKDARPK